MSNAHIKAHYKGQIRRFALESVQFKDLQEKLLNVFELHDLEGGFVVSYTDEDNDNVTIDTDIELGDALASTKGAPLRVWVAGRNVPGGPEEVRMNAALAPMKADVASIANMINQLSDSPPERIQELVRLIARFVGDTGGDADESEGNAGPDSGNSSETEPTVSNVNFDFGAAPAIHPYVQCDSCGVTPIVGIRYRCNVCADFDMCQDCEKSGDKHDPMHTLIRYDKPRKTAAHGITPGVYANNEFRTSGSGPRHHRHHFAGRMQTSGIAGLLNRKREDYVATFVREGQTVRNTVKHPREKFVKSWFVRNDGRERWPEPCRLMPLGRESMSVSEEGVILTAAPRPGETVELNADLIAPSHEGSFTGYWQLVKPDGNTFGDLLSVEILVVPATGSSEDSNSTNSSLMITTPAPTPIALAAAHHVVASGAAGLSSRSDSKLAMRTGDDDDDDDAEPVLPAIPDEFGKMHDANPVMSVTFNDGTEVASGATIHKEWMVLNDTSMRWQRLELKMIVGPTCMNALEVIICDVPPGQYTPIRVAVVAPANPGRCRCEYTLSESTLGRHVARLFIDVMVMSPQQQRKRVDGMLDRLQGIGLGDRGRASELLQKHQGDISKVVEELVVARLGNFSLGQEESSSSLMSPLPPSTMLSPVFASPSVGASMPPPLAIGGLLSTNATASSAGSVDHSPHSTTSLHNAGTPKSPASPHTVSE